MQCKDGSHCLLSVHVLSCCSRQLGLQGLACLAACSRKLRDTCKSSAKLDAACLLRGEFKALQEYASSHHVAHGRGLHAVLLLLQTMKQTPTTAPTVAAAEAAETLVNLPRVTLQQAVKLVEAGVLISYSQLMSAADSMVAGLKCGCRPNSSWASHQTSHHLRLLSAVLSTR